MNLSYWEYKTWLSNIDFAIIGSGIVGLSCALSLRKKFPKSKIVIFEKGMLPSGASTKNAGFACFGSISEILEDLKTHSEEELLELVRSRVEGLALLRETLGARTLGYSENGGYELFTKDNAALYEKCIAEVKHVNLLIKTLFPEKNEVFCIKKNSFGFKNVQNQLIFNKYEGQLDPGKMMNGLLQKIAKKGIFLMNCAEIDSFSPGNDQIWLKLKNSEVFSAKKLFIATNGFAGQFLKEDINPARAQVLITKPIAGLKVKGTFHLDRGFYYFRNIDNRILLGGGRNLDLKKEETTKAGLTAVVQNRLEELLTTTILPNYPFEIETRWSGIMGVGRQKKPIIKEVAPNVFCGVRLGGMGIAIGSSVGKQLAAFATT